MLAVLETSYPACGVHRELPLIIFMCGAKATWNLQTYSEDDGSLVE